jgi:lysophospholipase L1-like esterase
MSAAQSLRVFFFGDSICFGQGVSPHLTWVSRLSAQMTKKFEGRLDLTFQNPSVNGNTTRMALERMAYDVQSHRPDVLIIQFGMNDCNVWETDGGHTRVAPSAFAANLSEIVGRGRLFGAREIILGANHTTTRVRTNLPNVDFTYEESNLRYNGIIRDLAQKLETRLVDNEMAFRDFIKTGKNTTGDLLLPDELHLSKLGHDVYLQSYYGAVESAVAAVSGLTEGASA